ncbi:Purple acid phosphatase 26 isoform 1 [Hibiscus syriacus]|uniref:Purple acid phosphatase 26 isoform 1 n=1 Tax=Hibiscus syriacus TaxID=106335 RepID=A0A6A3CVM6_HIBSY|nr:Purple acid phosphatase 26 isoform 1 [Hibiscus syriacus]
MDQTSNQVNQHLLSLLKSFQKASKDLQKNPISSTQEPQSTIDPFLDLEKDANLIFNNDPNLFKLSQLLCNLKSLLEKLLKYQGYRLPCILRRQIIKYKIYQVACAIESDIQAYFDRESVQNLVGTLEGSADEDEDEKVKVLVEFEKRLSRGFDFHFQDLILKAKIFSILEHLLCDSSCLIRVRDQVALVIASLVRFNKDVFVGLVLMGPTVRALISMSSCCSIRVLSLLIKFIRIPLVDELEAHKEIPRIISLLSSENVAIQAEAMDCILGIAYYGRREAIEAMLEAGLVEKLVKLQGLEKQSNVDDNGTSNEEMESNEEDYMSNCPFEGCVARFTMQLESGEMLSKKEKIEFKLEILRRVREASVSEAEIASIVAEVLWGSSP